MRKWTTAGLTVLTVVALTATPTAAAREQSVGHDGSALLVPYDLKADLSCALVADVQVASAVVPPRQLQLEARTAPPRVDDEYSRELRYVTPEPSTALLLLAGGSLLTRRARRRP